MDQIIRDELVATARVLEGSEDLELHRLFLVSLWENLPEGHPLKDLAGECLTNGAQPQWTREVARAWLGWAERWA